MKKRKIAYIFKMIVKTMLLCFPMVMLFSSYYQKDQSQTTINYKYKTNKVSSADDLISGNAYTIITNSFDYSFYDLFELEPNSVVYLDIFDYDFELDDTCFIEDSAISQNYNGPNTLKLVLSTDSEGVGEGFSLAFYINTDEEEEFYVSYYLESNVCIKGYLSFVLRHSNDIVSVYLGAISQLSSSINPIESVITTNKTPNQLLNDWALDFYNMPINVWYKSVLNIFNANLNNPTMNIIYLYPLYILYVELFDIVLHLALLIPELIHKAVGDKD